MELLSKNKSSIFMCTKLLFHRRQRHRYCFHSGLHGQVPWWWQQFRRFSLWIFICLPLYFLLDKYGYICYPSSIEAPDAHRELAFAPALASWVLKINIRNKISALNGVGAFSMLGEIRAFIMQFFKEIDANGKQNQRYHCRNWRWYYRTAAERWNFTRAVRCSSAWDCWDRSLQ